ncbi:MFS transporter [Longispora albida]|uniref:MFS transporter n=1 Tax=Longispora albida TaxID=203523 RepID=UPI000378F391|nr:MFS transporter [Longispora albida]
MRALSGTYWAIWTGILINRLGGFAIIFLAIYLKDVRELSTSATGLIIGLHGAGGAVGVLAGGVLADRWGRRKTMLLAYVSNAALLMAVAVSEHIVLIGVSAALLGVSVMLGGPAGVAAITDVVPEPARLRAFNFMYWAFFAGAAIAALLVGVLADVSHLLLFSLDAASALAAAVLIYFRVPETLVKHPATGNRGLKLALTDRPYLGFVGLTFVLAVLLTQSTTMLPLAMKADGLSTGQYGLVMALSAAMVVLGQLFVPRLISRSAKGRVLALALLVIGVGFGATALTGSLAGYAVTVAVWTAGQMLAAPPNAAIIAELAPGRLRGQYQGVFNLSFALAAFAAPAAGGLSLEYLGDWHWAICLVLGLGAALGHLRTAPGRDRRAAELRAAEQPEREPALV